MTKEKLKDWMWQWLSPYANQFQFMDEFDSKLDKYAESKAENLPISTVSDLLKEDEIRDIFNAGFDEGYSNPMEVDGETVTTEEYEAERKKNHLDWLNNR
jgi:hypothetical protein